MPQTRYRALIKVLCNECQSNVHNKRKIELECKACKYLRYNNVNRLTKFRDFLNTKFPNWIWFNVYEYVKGDNGKLLQTFQKGKNEPTSDTL